MQWPLVAFELSLTVKYTYSTLSPATISLDSSWHFPNHWDVHWTFLLLLILFWVKYQFFLPSHAAVAACSFTQSLLCAALIYFSDWFCQKTLFIDSCFENGALIWLPIFSCTSSNAPSLFLIHTLTPQNKLHTYMFDHELWMSEYVSDTIPLCLKCTGCIWPEMSNHITQ